MIECCLSSRPDKDEAIERAIKIIKGALDELRAETENELSDQLKCYEENKVLRKEIKKLKEQNATLVEQNKQFNTERIYAQNHAALADKPVDKRVFVICNELKNLTGIPALSTEQKIEYLDKIEETIDTLKAKLQDENN